MARISKSTIESAIIPLSHHLLLYSIDYGGIIITYAFYVCRSCRRHKGQITEAIGGEKCL